MYSFSAYACIYLFFPYANENHAWRTLDKKTEQLLSSLQATEKNNSEILFVSFLKETGADILLLNENRETVSPFTFKKNNQKIFQGKEYPFCFSDSSDEYILIINYNKAHMKETKTAIFSSIKYIAVVILLMSFLCAFLFSRYTTRPIQRISKIADRIANLDFSWYCPDIRDDEIGILSKSINELSDKLHHALTELNNRNAALETEIILEKERERRRMLFFSSASHELKTPIAIVIGQLEGMQAGIGVYSDREKYLARSTEILQSLNHFIKEILFISHIDMEKQAEKETVLINISNIIKDLLWDYSEYASLCSIELTSKIEPSLMIPGDETLLKKALGNVLGNAIMHSPEYGSIIVKLSKKNNRAELIVFNSPAHIEEEHLPHLYEAFYRGDLSNGHGSGLGLYITNIILENYHVTHSIENRENGVIFTAVFEDLSQEY